MSRVQLTVAHLIEVPIELTGLTPSYLSSQLTVTHHSRSPPETLSPTAPQALSHRRGPR